MRPRRERSRAGGRGLLLTALLLAAGCASTRPFVYQPGTPRAGTPHVAAKVAVLPFQDGTEDFTRLGNVFNADSLVFNIAKSGIGGTIAAVTPPLWARAFADDLSASGRFQAAHFAFDASEVTDEEYVVDGTVRKAYASGGWEKPSEYALELRAVRRKDGRPVWERTVARSPKGDRSAYDGCGASLECMNDRVHAELNKILHELFDEAGEDLAKALGGRPAAGARDAAKGAEPESVERTIQRIMEGK